MIKSSAAVMAAILLGVLTNLVSNYFAPMANKARRLTLSAFAGICVLTLVLALVSDKQVQRLGEAVAALLRLEYGWMLVLLVGVGVGGGLLLTVRRALRLIVAPPLEAEERGYLQGVIREMDRLNGLSNWKDDYYVEARSEVVDQVPTVAPSYYLVQKVNPGVKRAEFETLPNAEKVENSRGLTYSSFKRAANKATDNAVVVLSAPGGGKTVTLRRLAKECAEQRLRNGPQTPVLINLGYYTGWRSPTEIEPFESFLESYFAAGYTSWLAGRHWEKLLQQGRCVVLLDGLDEIPRGTREHQLRLKEVERFVRRWPNTKFYLSCRELDYDYRLGFQQILIKPFDLRRVSRFLRLYFQGRPDLYTVGDQLRSNSSLFELAKVPFYLNLLCGFIRWREAVPANKSELFSFVIGRVIDREMTRQGAEGPTELGDRFVRAVCDLAAEMSLKTMTSTLSLDSYLAGRPGADHELLRIGIRGGLLELDGPTATIRFAHHRFQEFFCAFYITRHYHAGDLGLPPDFFLSIWWRETILMAASIDPAPTDFVRLMLAQRESPGDRPGSVAATMRLAVLALSHQCLLSNKLSREGELAADTRAEMVRAFPDETPMGKVTIINALAEDYSPEASGLLERAAKDRSQWVAERAFFVRTAGTGRFRPTLWSATKEFTRFLVAGRIFANAPDVVALATRFKDLRWLMPLFTVFALIGAGAVVAVGTVFVMVGKFLVLDLQYSLDARCLNCLANVSMTIGVLTYLLTRQRPWLQRFLLAAPCALMCWFLIFNLPDDIVTKAAAFGLGLIFYLLVRRRWPEAKSAEGTVVACLSGFFVATYAFRLLAGDLTDTTMPTFGSVQISFSMAMIFACAVAAGGWLVRDLMIIRRVRWMQEYASAVLREQGTSTETIDLLIGLFARLGSVAWAQRALLDRVIAQLADEGGPDEADRLDFLLRLGSRLPPSPFRDVLYQRCEEVSDNFRRSLGRPTTAALPQA